MGVLSNSDIIKYMKSTEEGCKLVVTPLLNKGQIGRCTIDLRLGNIFKVDKRTRTAVIDPVNKKRPTRTFFDSTYRDIGEQFILYPNQLVVAGTLEYVKIPANLFGEINTRSSMNRLGLSFSSVVQPGYAGIISLELINNSMNPIVLYPGIRIVQLKFLELSSTEGVDLYASNKSSKYRISSDPELSGLADDQDLEILKKFSGKNN